MPYTFWTNVFLSTMYSGIVIATLVLMTILVKFFREKALQKQNIRDQVSNFQAEDWAADEAELLDQRPSRVKVMSSKPVG